MMTIFHPVPAAVALVLFASACVQLPSTAPSAINCSALVERVDDRIEIMSVADAQTSRVDGFPYLRVDRFVASFRGELATEAMFDEWVSRLRELDRQARQIELQNLGAANIATTVDECAQTLLLEDSQREGFRSAILEAAHPPRHYDDAARAVGIYPLTQIAVALGFESWKGDNLPSFGRAEAINTQNETRYALSGGVDLRSDEIATLIYLSSQNALGIPDLGGRLLERLARQFAPIIAVEERSNADRIGRPHWPSEEAEVPQVDVREPTVYVRLAHTRFRGEILPQLVYTVWFPERPSEGAFDLLSGKLDGFVWRVTLGLDGKPLIYDSFHACGCYHLFFPVAPLMRQEVAADEGLREAPLAPMAAPIVSEDAKMVLHVASGSHYLRNLSISEINSDDRSLKLIDESEGPAYGMRSLPVAEGERRSLFGPDGIVPGTERGERFILWPMGIANAGAMRQWGTQATAFVGERHSDDPFLFEEAFAP